MLLNHLKIAYRNLIRHKSYSIINILGLAVGMACAIILLLFVWDELSYDRHNSNFDRIYSVRARSSMWGEEADSSRTPLPLAKALKDDYPAIEAYTRLCLATDIYFVDRNNEAIGEDAIFYADPDIFRIFDHTFIYGSPEEALDAPDAIVLSESLAVKFFGDINPVGKTLSRKNGIHYVVTGVFEDLPRNSSNRYDALITSQNLSENFSVGVYPYISNSFDAFLTQTYILLSEHAGLWDIPIDLKRFNEKHIPKEPGVVSHSELIFSFQPLKDVYAHSAPWPNSPINVLQRIYIFSALALFILAIACINYMNLATARSTGRAREVGVRKVLGADAISIIRQFLWESVAITIVAMLVALVLVEISLPSFNTLIGKELSLGAINPLCLLAGLLSVSILLGIFAGSYPAFVLSSFLPAKALKAGPQSGATRGSLRKILVVIQYAISVTMIICTILLIHQMNYIRNMDLGFNKNNVFFISPDNENQQNSIHTFKETIRNHPGISAVAFSSSVPHAARYEASCKIEDASGDMVYKIVAQLKVDTSYMDLMEMKILEGRSFGPDLEADQTGAILVNEALVKEMGWTDSPVGKRINEKGTNSGYKKVIGVVKDFHFQSLRDRVKPTFITLGQDKLPGSFLTSFVSIKIGPEEIPKALYFIEEKWLELNPLYPTEIISLEDTIDSQYRTEKTASRFFLYFAILGIFISCLGLFGLSSFMAENRTKEIGVRKVLGASVGSVVSGLSMSFLKPVLAGSIIACPFAHYAMSRWLENFAYKAPMSWWPFVGSVCIALIIALATVGCQAVKAALTDPVKALRYE